MSGRVVFSHKDVDIMEVIQFRVALSKLVDYWLARA